MFVEVDVHRLTARGVRVRVYALRGVGRQYQPRHAPLVALTESVGSPWDLRAWAAMLVWLLRRPGTLAGETDDLGFARLALRARRPLLSLPAACRVALL